MASMVLLSLRILESWLDMSNTLLMVQSSSSSKIVIGLDFLAFHHKDTKAQRKAA